MGSRRGHGLLDELSPHLAEAVHHVLLAAREAGTFERMVETVTRILLANAEAALDEGDDDE